METALRAYEVMVILDPDLEERTVAPSLDTYLNVVRNDGGTIENVDVWGRRRLAYEIDKKPEGIYAVVTLNAEPATVKELDRQLGLNESVHAHQGHPARHPLVPRTTRTTADSPGHRCTEPSSHDCLRLEA